MQITQMTALELGKKIKAGKLSVAEAANALYDAIEANAELNAYITLQPRDELLAQAALVQAKIDSGTLDSPLAGVPIGVKDNICTKHLRTTCASKIMGDFIPPYDASAIEKLKQAGAIILGKMNRDEFAMGCCCESSYYGPAKNPWDTARVPGGSSGGSAAAVAARAAFCALGSDTGGSIRGPAAFCGVTGFKPNYGAVSRYGLMACASSMDQIGPIGRDVSDCAAVLDIIKGKDCKDAMTIDLCGSLLAALDGNIAGKRIALPNECFGCAVESDVKERVLAMADTLKSLGAEIEYINLPVLDYVMPAYRVLCAAEASSNLARFDGIKLGFRADNSDGVNEMYAATRGEGFGDEAVKRILLGTFVLSSGNYDKYYVKAMQARAMVKAGLERVFEGFNAILCPTVPYTAPLLGNDPKKELNADIFAAAANLAGLPALSVPCGFDAGGLPVGAQLIGAHMDDAAILNLGYAYQQATDYHKQSPEVKI